MATITIRIDEEIKESIEKVAKFGGLTISEFIREAVDEKLEEEYAIKVVKEHEEDVKRPDYRTYSIDEVKEMLDIE